MGEAMYHVKDNESTVCTPLNKLKAVEIFYVKTSYRTLYDTLIF